MSGYFVKEPGLKIVSKTNEAAEAWDEQRFIKALTDNGISHAAISPNGRVWFEGVKKAVDAGACTFADFVAAYTERNMSWKDVLERVCGTGAQATTDSPASGFGQSVSGVSARRHRQGFGT